MKKITVTLNDFPFATTFILTTAIINKLKSAMVNRSHLIDFRRYFVDYEHGYSLDDDLERLFKKKRDTPMSSEEFEQDILVLMFRTYYNQKFRNEKYKELITLVQKKFELDKRITVIFAENMYDIRDEELRSPGFISDMDNTSSAIFPLFIHEDEGRPFETQKSILALSTSVFFIPKKQGAYIQSDKYTVDADVVLFKKPLSAMNKLDENILYP